MSKIVPVAAFASCAGLIVLSTTYYHYITMIVDRFPGIDRKTAMKAYNKFLMNSLVGKYSYLHDDAEDEEIDEIYLKIIEDLTK